MLRNREMASRGSGMTRLNRFFRDRSEAGKALAEQLRSHVGTDDSIVLALPRGGVPVGFEVALALRTDLDVFLVRKLGVPGHEELAMGAIAGGGVRVLNLHLIRELGLSQAIVDRVTELEQQEIARREKLYRHQRSAFPIRGRTAILVDDGLATGATMLAAAQALRVQQPERIIVGVPIAARDVCEHFRSEVEDVVCLATPDPFYGVGMWYEDFSQVSDEEVRQLLDRAAAMAHKKV
jgi:putative phosphoribosyl transferase